MLLNPRIISAITFVVILTLFGASVAFADEKRNRIGNNSEYITDVDYVFNICLQRCAETSVYRMALESCKSACAEFRRKFPLRDKGYSSLESCAKAMDNFDLNRDLLEKRAADWCEQDSEHVHKRQGCREASAAFYGAVNIENMCARGGSVRAIGRTAEPQNQPLTSPPANTAPLTSVATPLAPTPATSAAPATTVAPAKQVAPAAQATPGQVFPPMTVPKENTPAGAAPAQQSSSQALPVVYAPATPVATGTTVTSPGGSSGPVSGNLSGTLPYVNMPQTPVSSDTAVVLPSGQPFVMPSWEKGISPFSSGQTTMTMGPTLVDTPKYQTPEEVRKTIRRPGSQQSSAKPKAASPAAQQNPKTVSPVKPVTTQAAATKTAPEPVLQEKDTPVPANAPPTQKVGEPSGTSVEAAPQPEAPTPELFSPEPVPVEQPAQANSPSLEGSAPATPPVAEENDIHEPVVSMPVEPAVKEPVAAEPIVKDPPSLVENMPTPVVAEPKAIQPPKETTEPALPVNEPLVVEPKAAEPKLPEVPSVDVSEPAQIPDVEHTPPSGTPAARAPLADILVVPDGQGAQNSQDNSSPPPAPTPSMLKQTQPAPATLKPGA